MVIYLFSRLDSEIVILWSTFFFMRKPVEQVLSQKIGKNTIPNFGSDVCEKDQYIDTFNSYILQKTIVLYYEAFSREVTLLQFLYHGHGTMIHTYCCGWFGTLLGPGVHLLQGRQLAQTWPQLNTRVIIFIRGVALLYLQYDKAGRGSNI